MIRKLPTCLELALAATYRDGVGAGKMRLKDQGRKL